MTTLAEFNDLSPSVKHQRFHADHGPECYRDLNGSSFYYADGAVLEDSGGGLAMCIYHFPPDPTQDEGEYLLYRRKLRFAQLRLRHAVMDFDDLNTRLAHSLPGDPEGEIAKLKRLQAVVDQCKGFVAKAEKALANTRRGKLQAQALKAQEEENRRIAEFQAKRSAVRI